MNAAWIIVGVLSGLIVGVGGSAFTAALLWTRSQSRSQAQTAFLRRAILAMCVKLDIGHDDCKGPKALKTQELLAANDEATGFLDDVDSAAFGERRKT